jgi:hypothetical protein
MAKSAKLLAAIRANPRSVRLDDACSAAGFQNRDGYVPPRRRGRSFIAVVPDLPD